MPNTTERQFLQLLEQQRQDPDLPNPRIQPKEPPEQPPEEPEKEDDVLQRIRDFDLKPRDVRAHLDKYVISQDAAKKVVSVALCDHYNHVRQCLEEPELDEADYAKQNVLLLGPTGVGKTYLIRVASELIGVPFVKADATKFSSTGYVGRDTEELVRDLYKMADENMELTQYGMIYVDEIDKIAGRSSAGGTRDVSGRGVQTNLLKIMEETEVSPFNPMDMMAQMNAMMQVMQQQDQGDDVDASPMINTKHILVITSGAFAGLADSIRTRVQDSSIGFGAKPNIVDDDTMFLQQVTTADLVDYGFEPEFVGRLPVRVSCNELSTDDLTQILAQSEGSIFKQYELAFKGYGIELVCEDAALQAIAELAYDEKTGARGLMTVMERVFRDFKYELPSTDIDRLEMSRADVQNPAAKLKELMQRGT